MCLRGAMKEIEADRMSDVPATSAPSRGQVAKRSANSTP
jgi:hypothetical protein